MRVEFFGGPLDGDTAEFLDYEGGELGGKLVEIRIPTNAKTNRYMEAMTMPRTKYMHVYKRGKTGPNGIVRLDHVGYDRSAGMPVGG